MNISTIPPNMKRLLMVAYHFPPIQGSSGLHRTVQFARHLYDIGWYPIIVTVHPRAFPKTGDSMPAGMTEKCIVKRAFALDSARHLSIKGRYLDISAIPDRWVSWWPGGVWECMQAVRAYKPHAIWSTFPIATAHMIALTVHRLTGLPWIADFRDPMIQKGNSKNRWIRRAYQVLEKKIVQNASLCVTVTQSALKEFVDRYPENFSNKWQIIPNGYDESLFSPYDWLLKKERKKLNQKITMIHSGILYNEGRNPQTFLTALKSYLDENADDIQVIFRGCGNESGIKNTISNFGMKDFVSTGSSVSYAEAIKEMMQSELLLLFQGAVYNKQIPAKVYEYIRSGRPILAMIDKSGETAQFLENWEGVYIADIKSPETIKKAIIQAINDLKLKTKVTRKKEDYSLLSRAEGSKKLADILNKICNSKHAN
nr:glycosyltransferase [uncultured Desulfobacter sp.]